MTDLEGCRIGDVGVRFNGGGALEFRSASPGNTALLLSERKALVELSRIHKELSLSSCLICEPSGGVCVGDDGCTTLQLLLPYSSSSWVPLCDVEPSTLSKVLVAVANQLCEWHSAGVVHRTISPSSILVDPNPSSSLKITGPAIVLLHWACCSTFNATSNTFSFYSNLPHRVPSYAAPERLLSVDSSPPSPFEDFYGLGLVVKRSLCDHEPECLPAPNSDASDRVPSVNFSSLSGDSLWRTVIFSKPASTVLDYFLQPDFILRSFSRARLQRLIELHGDALFSSSCSSLNEQSESDSDFFAAFAGPLPGKSAVASLSWIQSVATEIVDGKCLGAAFSREIQKLALVGATTEKDIISFLKKLYHDRVIFRPAPWFTYLDINALKSYDVFVEKSDALIQKWDTMHSGIQIMLLHLAVCPYFIPYYDLVDIAQVHPPVSYEALVETGAVMSTVVNGVDVVRLASEELGALIEKKFPKETALLDSKFIQFLSSRKFPRSHPLGLSLAIHTARISGRISENESLLLEYLSDSSSTSISSMMDVLLRAAALLNVTPSLLKSKIWNSESIALTGTGLKHCFKKAAFTDKCDASILFYLYCEWHRSIARRLGFNNPDSVPLRSFVPDGSGLLLVQVALVEAEPSFLISKFSEANSFVEKSASSLAQLVLRVTPHAPSALPLQQQLDRWDSLEYFSAQHASSDQLWNIVRMAFVIAYSAGRDQIVRLLTSLVCSQKDPKFCLGLSKPEVELFALSFLHMASLSDSFKDESNRTGALSRLTFISEVGVTAQDFTGQILDNSVSFAIRVLQKIPMSLQLLDNCVWFVLAFFPLKHAGDKKFVLSNIVKKHFSPQEQAMVVDSGSNAPLPDHMSAAVFLEVICSRYDDFDGNIFRFFAKFWSVVFCIFEGSFVERNLLLAITSVESDAAKSAPQFIRDAFCRLRLMLQTSCRIQQLGSRIENEQSLLLFDDSDFEAIPLQLQVGLLACRGMMILHNGIAFNNEFINTEAADKASLQFFDRAESVSRLITPRVVRIGIMFAKTFISFRRSRYFMEESENAAASQEESGDFRQTSSIPGPSSLLGQQMLCFSEGLKYFKTLCKLLHVAIPLTGSSVSMTIGLFDYSALDLIPPDSSLMKSFENIYGFGLVVLCLAMMSLTDEERSSQYSEYKRIALRLLLRDGMYHYAIMALEDTWEKNPSVDSESAEMLVRSIAIRSFVGHADTIFKLFSLPLGWSIIGTSHFSRYFAISNEEGASEESVAGSMRSMNRLMRSHNVLGQRTVKLHSQFAALKLQTHNLGVTLKLKFQSLRSSDKPLLNAVPEFAEQDDPVTEQVLKLLECASSSIARETFASRIVILRENMSNFKTSCAACLNFCPCPSSVGVEVQIENLSSDSLERNNVSELVLDYVSKQNSDIIFVESYPLSKSSNEQFTTPGIGRKRTIPGVVSFSSCPVISASKIRSVAVIALSLGSRVGRYFIWLENAAVANLFGADSSQDASSSSLTRVFFLRLQEELRSAILHVLSPDVSFTSSSAESSERLESSNLVGNRTAVSDRMSTSRKPAANELENSGRMSVNSRMTSSGRATAKPSAFDLMSSGLGLAAPPEPVRHQSDVNFLVPGSSWKTRRVVLDSLQVSYIDKYAKKQALLTISPSSVISEPSASTISPRAPADFLLWFEGTQEKKPSSIIFAFPNAISRDTWKSAIESAIENGADEIARKEFTTINVCNPTIEEMKLVRRVGKGGFGEVYEYYWGGISLAVKKLSADLSAKNISLFKQEAELMSKMRHPNILLYISSSLEPPNLYIVTEYMPRGSLFDVLHDTKIPLSWYIRVRMALDCASAMLYLHSSDPCIVHRDLKAENLLVSDGWNVKVCDFGLTRFSAQVDPSRGAFATGSSSQGMTSNIGSTRYCAPEVLGHRGKHVPYTNAVDVHSFGMILYEMAHRGRRPYWQLNQDFALIRQKIMEGERPKFEDATAPAEFRDLYRACVNHDPKSRPNFAQISKRLARLLVLLESEPQEQSASAALGK